MDTNTINHVSLCSGYGGIDLGLKRVFGERIRTVAYCEIEAFAVANLVSKAEAGLLDNAPVWSDLKRFPWGKFRGLVDILSGGYPCQPFSAAGKRLGKDDPRHLWPWIADGIDLMRPSVCFFENVEGHISMGLPDVIEDLAGMGYRTTWGIFSAAEVGAPHQRKRVFILATAVGLAHGDRPRLEGMRECNGSEGREISSGHLGGCGEIQITGVGLAHPDERGSRKDQLCSELRAVGLEQPSCDSRVFSPAGEAGEVTIWPSRPGQPQHGWEPPRVVGNSSKQGCEGRGGTDGTGWKSLGSTESDGGCTDGRMEQEQWQTQPPLGGNPHGASCGVDYAELCVSCDNRTDELRLLGNGVVPATAERAFITLFNELNP